MLNRLAHLCSTVSTHSPLCWSSLKSGICLACSKICAHLPCSSSGLLNWKASAHLLFSSGKSAHLGCSLKKQCSTLPLIWKRVLNSTRSSKEVCSSKLAHLKKVLNFVAHLKKSTQPPCSSRDKHLSSLCWGVGKVATGAHLKKKSAHPSFLIWKKNLISLCSTKE